MKWESANIGECADLISGPAFKSAHFTDHPDDIPLVKGENVQQSFVDWSIAKRWPRSDAAAYERFLLAPDDIVVAMDRPWVPAGLKWASISDADPQALLVQRIARLRATPSVCPKFLKYVIASPDFSDYVRNVMGGTNVPHISGDQIRKFTFPLPPISDQRSIGSTLAAYDDLIQNNRRRIALLEQSARLLYREWFVHLRFPGHEHAEILDGVPNGWRRAAVEEMFATTSGGTPSRANATYFDGDINWVKTQELDELFIFDTEEHISDSALENSAAKLFPEGTLLVSIYGGSNIGRTGLLARPAASNQACVALMPKRKPDDVLFAQKWFQENRGHLVGLGQGAAQTNISQKTLKSQRILWPTDILLEEFTGLLRPMYDQIANLCQQNSSLAEARDLLLPRLMRGEVEV